MNNLTVNKVIAKYMDRRCENCGEIDHGMCCWPSIDIPDWFRGYTESIDEQMPVVEKLKAIVTLPYGGSATVFGLGYSYSFREDRNKSSESLAHALARAILGKDK
jgi:hypothetical protein